MPSGIIFNFSYRCYKYFIPLGLEKASPGRDEIFIENQTKRAD